MPVFSNGFVFDDDVYLVHNEHVQAGLTRASIAWAFTTGHGSNWHPLTWLSLQLDHELFGMQPWGYHFVNLVLHVVNTVLLLRILWKMTGAWWQSALVAALFTLHPLHVESVAWLAERKDVLSTFFGFLAVVAYGSYVNRPTVVRYLLILLAYAASLLAKPMLVTLPFVLLLLDYWPLCRVPGKVSLARLVVEKIPLLLLAAGSSVAAWTAQAHGQSVQALERLSFPTRAGNALVSYVVYLRKMIWPADLAAFYPHPMNTLPLWQVLAAGLFLLAVSAVVIWLWRRAPYLAVGWFWYLGTLVPVIGLVQVGAQAYADRYTYVPLIGIFIALVWGGADLLARWSSRDRYAVASAAAAVVLLACTLLTWLQVHYWHDAIPLWEHALAVAPSAPAYTNLAAALVQDPSSSRKDQDRALDYFTEAVALEPSLVEANVGLADLLLKRGRLGDAVQRLQVIEQVQPHSAANKYRLGSAMALAKDWPAAETYLKEAIRLDPRKIAYREMLAAVYSDAGRVADAIAMQRSAVEVCREQGRTDYLPVAEQNLRQYEQLQSKAKNGKTGK
jgi:lipopolysaccharide biosynthesis regulator YciM